MSQRRKDVDKIREILRLCLELNYSVRDAALALGSVSKTTVSEYVAEFKRTQVPYQELAKDFEYIEKELKRTGVGSVALISFIFNFLRFVCIEKQQTNV